MRNAPLRQVIFVLLAIAVAAALFTSISLGAMTFADASFKDAAASVQSIGILVILSVGGALAYYRFYLFRSSYPNLTVVHEVSHRRVGDSYVHIAVNASLHNGSRVRVEIDQSYSVLQRIAPTTDDEISQIYQDARSGEGYDDFQWDTIEEIPRSWPEDPISIEPSESYTETIEFIVSTEFETVLIYTHFDNSETSEESSQPTGWDATTVYDIHDTMTAQT